MCTTVAGNNSSSGNGAGSYSNGPIQPGSSPAGLMLMSSNATTPSPRTPSASSSPGLYSHHPNAGGHGHTPTASPSPQHGSSHVQPNRTPPSSYGHSPLSHLNNHDNNNGNSGCFDVVNRLKNRMDLYRGHHENALAKEHVYIDQCNQKIKVETNRLVKKQTVANEANSVPSNNRKKNNSSMGSTGTGGAGGGRARANANKRSAACLLADSNSPNTMTPAGAMTSVCANSPASSSPTPAGPASKAKVPRMTAKQRKLLKQQQLDGTMVAPNSQLMMNCSMSGHHQQQHQNLNSNNHQTTSTNTTNQELLNGSSPSVYKFDPHSPQDQKPSVNFLNNNSGLSSSYMQQQHNYHQPQQLITIKQENFQSSCSSSYLGQLDANSLHDLLGNSGQAQHSSMSLNHQQNSSLPDDDSKDLIINQILELDPDDNISMMSITPGSNGQNGLLSNDHSNSIFGTSADESLSNRFGDEDFIKKMLEDLNNGFETTSNGSCNSSNGSNSIHHFHHQSSSSSSVQMVESFRFNDSTSGNSPVMNGNGSDSMMNHLSSQQPRNHNQLEQQNSFNSFSNPSTPTMMMNTGSSSGSTGSSPMNHYGGASSQTPQQQQQLPNFNQLRQTQPNASLPSFNTLAANGNGQHSLSGQSPRLNAQLTNSNTNQVPNHGGNNCNANPLLAAQQPLSNHSMTPTPPGSSSPINSHAHQMMCKSPYGRPNSAGPPGNNAGQQTTPSNLLLHPVINQASPDPVRTPPLSNQAKMMTSPMMCHGQRVNNTPSPVSSPHQNVSMMCPRASSSTPPTPGASGVVNNSGPNASVALKQMAQQQQNKWNQGASSTAANSNDFYNQQSQMMMRQSPGQPQQRLMMQQQQTQSYTQPQQILSSQLQNSNPNQMMQQYHRPNTIIPGNGVQQQQQQQQQQRAQMAYGTSQQQPRPAVANNNANANFYQRCATGNNLAPQQQQIVRNQNIRAQRMMQQQTRIQQQQQQQQQLQQHRFSHGQPIRPQTSFNPQQSSQQQQQQMSSFASRQSASMINVSPQTQPIMSTQRFVNNANNNHWASSQSMQQQQQQTMMAPSQQQHQQQQYSMPNYGPPHGAGAPITNSGDSSNSNTGGYF